MHNLTRSPLLKRTSICKYLFTQMILGQTDRKTERQTNTHTHSSTCWGAGIQSMRHLKMAELLQWYAFSILQCTIYTLQVKILSKLTSTHFLKKCLQTLFCKINVRWSIWTSMLNLKSVAQKMAELLRILDNTLVCKHIYFKW